MRKDCKTTVDWKDPQTDELTVMSYYQWTNEDKHWGVRPIRVEETEKNKFNLEVQGTLDDEGVIYHIKNVSFISLEVKGLRYLVTDYIKNRDK